MQTTFQKEWIAKQNTDTVEGYAKATMLRYKYDLMNTETLWLDDYDNYFVSFVGNLWNYETIERNKKGLQTVASKIFKKFDSLQQISFGHLLFTRT